MFLKVAAIDKDMHLVKAEAKAQIANDEVMAKELQQFEEHQARIAGEVLRSRLKEKKLAQGSDQHPHLPPQ